MTQRHLHRGPISELPMIWSRRPEICKFLGRRPSRLYPRVYLPIAGWPMAPLLSVREAGSTKLDDVISGALL